jgi:hypothetical protein
MEHNELLPIGSVVRLKNATHDLMIIGYTPMRDENELKIFDYWGVFYPEGMLKAEQSFVFNRDQIDRVVNVGFSTDAEKEFRAKIDKILHNVKNPDGSLKMNQAELAVYMRKILIEGVK